MAVMSIINFFTWYLAAISVITFILFGFDKWMAGSGARRIPEATLWLASALGGSFGAVIAMQVFRHKTRKASFQLVLALIIFLQAAVGFTVWYFELMG